jgi:prepilin-type N-terminal cleavage/methylation domain-containing protein
MKLNKTKLGFTLIELLVVITIIGILATWAVTIYTAQIQKARDTTRINDIKALQSAIEQVYQDTAEYPHSDAFADNATDVDVKTYMEKIPSDPKSKQTCFWGSSCDYLYVVAPDANSIAYGVYELSTAFENEWNVKSKAAQSWNDNLRFEIWLSTDSLDTANNGIISSNWCLQVDWSAATATSLIKLANDWC